MLLLMRGMLPNSGLNSFIILWDRKGAVNQWTVQDICEHFPTEHLWTVHVLQKVDIYHGCPVACSSVVAPEAGL